MQLELAPTASLEHARAARTAAAHAGVGFAFARTPVGAAWWRAGLEEAHARRPPPAATRQAPPAYEAAPSPRNTRGATRA
jgi:hypothetical protein